MNDIDIEFPSRDDYHAQVPTREANVEIHISQGELCDNDNPASTAAHTFMLLQVGSEGNYACAYLNDIEARELANRILYYLDAEENT